MSASSTIIQRSLILLATVGLLLAGIAAPAQAQPPKPAAPPAATAGNGSVTVSWSPPPDGVADVQVRIFRDDGTLVITQNAGGVVETSLTETLGILNGTTYYATVAWIGVSGEGPQSDPSNLVTPMSPDDPDPDPGPDPDPDDPDPDPADPDPDPVDPDPAPDGGTHVTVTANRITGSAGVDDPAPDGCTPSDCSLREAVRAANATGAASTIRFAAAGTVVLGRTGSEQGNASVNDLDVSRPLLVVGHEGGTTISGAGFGPGADSRAFSVLPPGSLELRDLTVTGGNVEPGEDGAGGAVFAFGPLELTRVIITGNQAPIGGGVAAAAGLTVTDSTFSDNTAAAVGSQSNQGAGGAVAAEGSAGVTVHGSTFTGNRASSAGGAMAILTFDTDSTPMPATITDSTFSDNTAQGPAGSGAGGAVVADVPVRINDSIVRGNRTASVSVGGGLALIGPGESEITNTTLADNESGRGGGAVYLEQGGVTIDSSTLSGNAASGPDGEGGGVLAQPTATGLAIINSTVSANTSGSGGAGLHIGALPGAADSDAPLAATVMHATIVDNDGGDAGIDVPAASATVSLSSTIVAANGSRNCTAERITSAGWNLEDADDCGLAHAQDSPNTDPAIEPLADNGGTPQGAGGSDVGATHALMPGSPAIDAADPGGCPDPVAVDQRGADRPAGDGCDVGAYEAGQLVGCVGLGEGDDVDRLEGLTRIQTAVAVSAAICGAGQAPAVVLTRADAFPDAQAGTPLAVALGAPLLLSAPEVLSVETEEELGRVLEAGGTVYLLGGTAALSEDVARQVEAMGYATVRYGGVNRAATASVIASEGLGDPSTVLLADGEDFASAIVAGVAAATFTDDEGLDAAVLLSAGDVVPPETAAYLEGQAVPPTVVTIGPGAAQAMPAVESVTGSSAFETSTAVARRFFSAPSTVGIAREDEFADGLSGGALMGRPDAGPGPILLTSTDSLSPAVAAYLSENADGIDRALIFGGPVAVSAEVEAEIRAALGS